MAVKIILKHSRIPGETPRPGSLLPGELFINTADGKFFAEQSIKGAVPISAPMEFPSSAQISASISEAVVENIVQYQYATPTSGTSTMATLDFSGEWLDHGISMVIEMIAVRRSNRDTYSSTRKYLFKNVANVLTVGGSFSDMGTLDDGGSLAGLTWTIDAVGTDIRIRITGVFGVIIDWLANIKYSGSGTST